MPNAGMLDHDALQKSHPQASPVWMPAWPAQSFGYRTLSARPRRHTIETALGQGAFSRHLMTSTKQQQQQENAEPTSGNSTQRARPFSAPAELHVPGSERNVLPITPFTARLMTISDDDELKSDPSSTLWTAAGGQRRLKGPNDVKAPFHTMQKVTCGAFFTRNTDHRMMKFGIRPVNTPRWRSEGRKQS